MGPDVFITTTFSSSMERSLPRDDANPSLPDGAQEPGSEPPALVVGVDGSNGSSEAPRWAIAEARLRSVPLRAIHAWTYSQPLVSALAGYAYGTESVDYTVDDRWEAEQRLERATSELGEEHEIEIERVVAAGSAAQVLIHAVAETDLLVVGPRGHGGFTNLLIGSVSRQCAPHSRCPVVIVRGRSAQPVSRPTQER
jgi:nucleotide-binding universal stress UspA family protein